MTRTGIVSKKSSARTNHGDANVAFVQMRRNFSSFLENSCCIFGFKSKYCSLLTNVLAF